MSQIYKVVEVSITNIHRLLCLLEHSHRFKQCRRIYFFATYSLDECINHAVIPTPIIELFVNFTSVCSTIDIVINSINPEGTEIGHPSINFKISNFM